jgi:hypothetical protein
MPSRNRLGDALDLDSAEIAVLEEIADQPAGACGDDDGIRLGQGLQPGGQVGRFTDDRLLLRRTLANQIANDHQPGGNADARLELDGFDIETTDIVDDAQSRPDRPLGIVFMRSRVTEIDQNPVAHVFGDKAIEASDDIGDGAVISGNNLAQILGVEPRRELGRTDQIAEHHRQLPSLCTRRHRAVGGVCGAWYRPRTTVVCSGLVTQCSDGVQ